MDTFQQAGRIACNLIKKQSEYLLTLNSESKDVKELAKKISEFLELHYLLGWILQYPLKISKNHFRPKVTTNHQGSSKQVKDYSMMIRRRYCGNCGRRNQDEKMTKEVIDY